MRCNWIIGVISVLTERSIKYNQTVYVGFVDYEKAFDRINWKKMMEILNNIGFFIHFTSAR